MVKRPWRGVDYTPSPSAEVKEKVELYLYSTSGELYYYYYYYYNHYYRHHNHDSVIQEIGRPFFDCNFRKINVKTVDLQGFWLLLLSVTAGCYWWLLLLSVTAGCYYWLLLVAVTTGYCRLLLLSYCRLLLLAVTAGCYCWLLLLAVTAGCYCWLLLLAVTAGCISGLDLSLNLDCFEIERISSGMWDVD